MIFHIIAAFGGIIGAALLGAGFYLVPFASDAQKYLPVLMMMCGFVFVFIAISHFVR